MTDYSEEMDLAIALGAVLAAEGPCDFSYDQTQIATWIGNNIPPAQPHFAYDLKAQTEMAADDLKQMSVSEKTAQCALARAAARKFGFIK